MLKVAVKLPLAPESSVPTTTPPTPRVPIAPIVTVQVRLVGKSLVLMVTLVLRTTSMMVKVGTVWAAVGRDAGSSASSATQTTAANKNQRKRNRFKNNIETSYDGQFG
ncbi:MAG: hypothetical protein Fur0021_19150 [Candidatus Promineifilaceae bacterium]